MKKADVLLIIAMLLMAGFVWIFFLKLPTSSGGTVCVYIDGEVYDTYDLYEDQEIVIDESGFHNHFRIKDGSIMMIEADCPDQYCVKHAPIDKENETIVCLPHKVVIEITSGGEKREVDG